MNLGKKLFNFKSAGATLLLAATLVSLGGCLGDSSSSSPTGSSSPTVMFQFAMTDDSRGAGGGPLTPANSAGFGNSNLAQSNGVGTVVMTAIAKDIAAQNAIQKIDFVLFPGDMINGYDQDPNHLGSEMDTWKTAMAAVYNANIPVYTTRGNHEYSSLSALEAANPADPSLAPYKARFPIPTTLAAINNPPSAAENGLTYSFTYKNAKFIAFDNYANRTAAFDNTKFAPGSNKGQMMNSWVLSEVNNSTAGVNFVMSHELAWGNPSGHTDGLPNDPDSRDALVLALGAKNGTYLAGHDHMYVRGVMTNGTAKIPAFVVGAAGGGNYNWSVWDAVKAGYTGLTKYATQKVLANSKAPQFGYLLVTVYSDNTWTGQFRGFNFNTWNSPTDVSLTPITVLDSFKNTDILN